MRRVTVTAPAWRAVGEEDPVKARQENVVSLDYTPSRAGDW